MAHHAHPIAARDADDLEDQELLLLTRAEVEAALQRGDFKALPGWPASCWRCGRCKDIFAILNAQGIMLYCRTYPQFTGKENSMINRIALITIVTDDVPRLAAFYRDVLGFAVKTRHGWLRRVPQRWRALAVCARSILRDASSHASYEEAPHGQHFELAFPCGEPAEVDRVYAESRGAGRHTHSRSCQYALGPAHRHVR